MAEEDKKAWDEYEQDRDAALRREQQQSRRQQELLRQQQQYQQQYAQQYQQQQYQQQYAQQLYQQYQQQFMADLRQQQQQQLYIQAQQQQQEQQQPQQAVANGLPGYDVMSLEDIVKYVKGLYSSIDSQSLIERMYSIISSGLESCQKEMQSIEMQMSVKPNDPVLAAMYQKVAKQVNNLNVQQYRANLMFKANANMHSGQTY